MTPDLINACFNIGGAIAISTSTYKLLQDKIVRGIQWAMMIFFISWSTWNMYLYYSLGLWYSVGAGALMVASELTYISFLIYYSNQENNHKDAYQIYLSDIERGWRPQLEFDPHSNGAPVYYDIVLDSKNK